jgi:hypothetical protein
VKDDPTFQTANTFLAYDASTGLLEWRARDRKYFPSDNACNSWNAKFANKPAFTATDGKGYKVGALNYKLIRAHRIIWLLSYGEWPNTIDHINGNKLDNRLDNLRSVSHAENMRNLPIKSNNTSGYLGVTWAKRDKKWSVRIKHNGRTHSLGNFAILSDAIRKRKEAEEQFGYHDNHGRALS